MAKEVRVPTEWAQNSAFDLQVQHAFTAAGIDVAKVRNSFVPRDGGKLTSVEEGRETIYSYEPGEGGYTEPVNPNTSVGVPNPNPDVKVPASSHTGYAGAAAPVVVPEPGGHVQAMANRANYVEPSGSSAGTGYHIPVENTEANVLGSDYPVPEATGAVAGSAETSKIDPKVSNPATEEGHEHDGEQQFTEENHGA